MDRNLGLTALSGCENQLSHPLPSDQDLSPPHGKLNSRIQRVITYKYNMLRTQGYVQFVYLLGVVVNYGSGLPLLLTFLGMQLQPEISTAAD